MDAAAREGPDPSSEPSEPSEGPPAEGPSEASEAPPECAICQDSIAGRRLRRLRGCGHCFHGSCISRWLRRDSRMSCPLCRAVALEGLSDERTKLSARVIKLLEVCAPPECARPRYWLHEYVRALLDCEDVAASLKVTPRQRQAIVDLSFAALTLGVFPIMLEAWERGEKSRERLRDEASSAAAENRGLNSGSTRQSARNSSA